MELLFLSNDVNIHNILVSNKIFSGEKNHKYFIGYLDEKKIKPFSIILPKRNAYIKSYDGKTKWMYFLFEDEEFLRKCNDIWNDIINSINGEFYTYLSTIKICKKPS